MIHKAYPISMEISGNTAIWTRPDSGDSPCSYPAPTYSAVRALFESVLWGPAVLVIPRKVELCTIPQYHSYATNYGGPLRKNDSIKKGNNYQMFATVLIDVCYRLYADVIPNPDKSKLLDRALEWDEKTTSPGHAYQEIFNRRLKRGQSYATLALGWREFTSSYVGPFRETTHVCEELPDIHIPSMLRGVFQQGYCSEYQAVYDTNLCIHRGTLVYPERRHPVKYIAHKDGEREQPVLEHLEGTANLAGMFASAFGKRDWGYCCGLLHDIGKYSDEFQKKIKTESDDRVDHATAGAQECEKKGGLYPVLEYCIAGHHAGLPDYGKKSERTSLTGRLVKKIPDYHHYADEISFPSLKTMPIDPETASDPDFSLSVFIRMLYSCLVDADFLDTECFMQNGKTDRDQGEPMECLLEKLEKHVSGWLKNKDLNTMNGRRTEILRHCMELGQKAERGLFRLTVPTGGGKTVASLAFALRHAAAHHMDHIIYVIPYTSIIEQNAVVFREILGDQNVLEHHSNMDYTGSEELRPMQLATENWGKPVVVTTNVQFFESLFASKSSKCRKLHNIANSVIIFDEAQMFPIEYLKPCLLMMEELVANYRSSIVLCTATQPAFTDLFRREWNITELCPRIEEQFAFFKRMQFEHIGVISEDDMSECLQGEHQVLCIVNTKKRAQSLYQRLKGDGVFHLSTSMYPKHRRSVLKVVRERLKNGERCVLVSTSLVEAGVDLDFETVYRQIAGFDSMIQAAGRCNREGKRPLQESLVYIFDFEGEEKVPGQRLQIETANSLLKDGADLSDSESITNYFKMLYHHKTDQMDKKDVLSEFKNKDYHFAKVGNEFRLIEEGNVTIFINREEEASYILQQLRFRGYTKGTLRKAQQYCVSIYDKEFEKMNGAGMLRPVSEDLEDFYELIQNMQYTDDMGLKLGAEQGIAIIC